MMALKYLSILSLCCGLLSACSQPTLQADNPCQSSARPATCQQQRYQAIDVQLNQAYQQLQRQLAGTQAKALRHAQRLWLPYRDLHCQYVIAEHAADIQTSLKWRCLAQLTQSRVDSFKVYPQPVTTAVPAYTTLDTRLNQLYQQHKRSLPTERQQHLRQTQRAWLAFRDAECAARQHPDCLADLTHIRNAQLEFKTPTSMLPSLSSSTAQSINEQQLIGTWQRLNYQETLHWTFGIHQGVHHYLAQLEQLPHEAGQWQLKPGRLSITDSRGRLLHEYQILSLRKGVLSLQRLDGSQERYQQVSISRE